MDSPLTAATVFGLALIASMALAAGEPRKAAPAMPGILIAAVLGAVVLCFVRAIPYYFISDDYFILTHSRQFTLSHIPWMLTNSDRTFFRPISEMSWYLEYRWVGASPSLFHSVELAMHVVTCGLVYLLISDVFESRNIGLWTAAFFGLHPANDEAVSYLGGGQQILFAGVFLLATLVLFARHCRRPSTAILAASLLTGLVALWSKESAFVLPILAGMVAWRMQIPLRKTIPYWILTGAAFIYRWVMVGGIGGYQETHATLLGVTKALALRLWAIVALPVNWSTRLEIYAVIGLAAGIAGYLMLTYARPARRDVLFAAGWIVLCASAWDSHAADRVESAEFAAALFSTIGFGLLLACAIETLPRMRLATGMALVLFFVTTLEHNLTVWGEAAEAARQTCAAAAAGDASIKPPGVRNGIWFFANGFEDCVALRRAGVLPH